MQEYCGAVTAAAYVGNIAAIRWLFDALSGATLTAAESLLTGIAANEVHACRAHFGS